MSSASKTVDQQVRDYGAAQEKDVSIPQYYLEDQADLEFKKLQVSNPLEYTDNNADYWKTWLMDQDAVILKATERADFNAKVMSRSTDFTAGKASAKTLTSLATRQNIGLTKAVLNTLTGNTRSVDVFNDAMDNLSQIKIAKEIYNLSTARLQSASNVVAATGDIKMGMESLGIDVTGQSYKKVLKDIENGNKTTYQNSVHTDNSGQVRMLSIVSTIDLEGNEPTAPTVLATKIGSPNKPPTYTELLNAITKNQSIYKNVQAMVGEKGLNDFIRVGKEKGLIKNVMTIEDQIRLQAFATDYTSYTDAENYIQPLTEQDAALMSGWIKASPRLFAIIDNPNSDPVEDYAQILAGLTMTLRAGREAVSNISQAERPQERPAWVPDGYEWSGFKGGGWYKEDPNKPNSYLEAKQPAGAPAT